MGWEAASWLMDTGRLASFHGPAASTPQESSGGPHSADDAAYEDYLDDWIRRVETGEMDCMEAA